MANETEDVERFERLLEDVHRKYGYDFSHYTRASLHRRLNIFLTQEYKGDFTRLADEVMQNDRAFATLLQTITVNVTEMFRDPLFFRALREKVLPDLSSYPYLKIWHAGCSTGEEVYSMAIVLKEAGLLERTRLYGTDINSVVVEKAKQGRFPLRYMREYTQNYLQSGGTGAFSEYYQVKGNMAEFDPALKKQMVFALHNLEADQSFNEFNLVVCRNVMIYFDKELQARVIRLFNESLCPLGYLALGTKESLLFSDVKDNFETIEPVFKIYRKIK